MTHYIPVLTGRDAQFLLKYFAGVDKALSSRFALGFLPDEEHLTSLLCELLDDKGSGLHQLPYSVGQLNEDLKRNNSLLNVSFKLETIPYNKYQERNITQSDIGIIVNYADTIKRNNSFRKGVLLQAKKLFPQNNRTYTLDSEYRSFDLQQHKRLYALAESIARLKDPTDSPNFRCAGYLLYNPPFESLMARDKEVLLYQQIDRLHHETRDGMYFFLKHHGLLPYFTFNDPTDIAQIMEASSLVIPLDDMHSIIDSTAASKVSKDTNPSLGKVMEHASIYYNAFAHFIVLGMLLGHAGCQEPEWLRVISGLRPSVSLNVDLFRPRFVLTINLTAGTALG